MKRLGGVIATVALLCGAAVAVAAPAQAAPAAGGNAFDGATSTADQIVSQAIADNSLFLG
ncbi:hypothetical protein [Streptomyces sp. URMC 123]|uniref:hypothetical protein n=1 Tax=Streptomyces sp. URMC 123 TaxID=3423403 RepID=UPI003F1D6ADB